MAVFIEVTTNALNQARDDENVQLNANVRRPLRGLQIKQDTYAVIRVIGPDGNDLPIFNSSSSNVEDGIGRSAYYANFIINGIEDQRMEKQTVVETFGEDFIFFFGERPRFLSVSGMLINSADFNWKNERTARQRKPALKCLRKSKIKKQKGLIIKKQLASL
jgi:cAMP phosphodiesterase